MGGALACARTSGGQLPAGGILVIVSKVFVSAAVFAAFFGSAASLYAEEKKLPIAQAERPITLPEMTLAPEASIDFQNTSVSTAFGSISQFDFATSLGAAFGITNDLEVHASLAPVKWTHHV